MIQVREEFIQEAYEAACSTWKKRIEQELPSLFPSYKVGQRFEIEACRYILARVRKDTVVLICLDDGNRFTDPVDVINSCNITAEEFRKLTSNYTFKLI